MKKQKEQKKEESDISPAHEQAIEDIYKDPELHPEPAPEDGLDEGELARLEGED